MEKKFLKNHFASDENLKPITIENLKNYINYEEFKKIIETKPTKKLYYNTCKYNQATILNGFIIKLFETFKDNMLLCIKYHEVIKIYNRNDEKLQTFNNFLSSDFSNYFTFIINNYEYYIQFADNPFFDNSSYISCRKIYKFDNSILYADLQNKFFTFDYYGGGYNINNLIYNVYSKDNNINDSINNLFDYFMKNKYKKENLRYTSIKDERIFILNHDENKTDRHIITGVFDEV